MNEQMHIFIVISIKYTTVKFEWQIQIQTWPTNTSFIVEHIFLN